MLNFLHSIIYGVFDSDGSDETERMVGKERRQMRRSEWWGRKEDNEAEGEMTKKPLCASHMATLDSQNQTECDGGLANDTKATSYIVFGVLLAFLVIGKLPLDEEQMPLALNILTEDEKEKKKSEELGKAEGNRSSPKPSLLTSHQCLLLSISFSTPRESVTGDRRPVSEPPVLPPRCSTSLGFDFLPGFHRTGPNQVSTKMAMLSRARVLSSTLFSKLAHHPPIHRTFSSPSTPRDKSSQMMDNNPLFSLDISSQTGSCMPISMMRIGTIIHNIEMNPGQGGKLVRAAGTSAKILKEPSASKLCLIRLPSGVEKLVDSRCRATIGVVSNAEHATKKLRKAGQSRWLGRRPVVRGVAMNPVDHPHGGGEGKSKSSGCRGGVSRTPWGKPTKSGFKTGPLKRRK
ncbi:hypothetical protein LXL04_033458 [Taraxacum kok-saghyz]